MSTLCSQCWFIEEPKHWNGQNIWKTLPKKALYELKYCGTFTLHLQLLGHGNPRHEAPGVPCLCWCFGALLAAYIELLKLLLYMWTVYNIILKPFHEQVSPFSSFSTPQWDHFLAHICYITIKNMLYVIFFIVASDIHNVPFKHGIWATVMAKSFGSGTKYIMHFASLAFV